MPATNANGGCACRRLRRGREKRVEGEARKLGRTDGRTKDAMAYAAQASSRVAHRVNSPARPRSLAVRQLGGLAGRRPAAAASPQRYCVVCVHANATRLAPRAPSLPGSVRPSVRASVRPSVMTHFLDLMKQRGLCPSVRSSFSSSIRRRQWCLVNSDSPEIVVRTSLQI